MKSPEILLEKHIQTISDGTNTSVNDNNIHSPNHNLSNIQLKKNHTGLPDKLKSGIENLSGHSFDDVKVHYNSSKPAQLQAHAYAQGTDIHLASGQEKHLPHEAWHVVQQKQGRVKPTMQMKGKVNVNNSAALEKEADVMGTKALHFKNPDLLSIKPLQTVNIYHKPVQRVKLEDFTTADQTIVKSDEFKAYLRVKNKVTNYEQWLNRAQVTNVDTWIKGFKEKTPQELKSYMQTNPPNSTKTVKVDLEKQKAEVSALKLRRQIINAGHNKQVADCETEVLGENHDSVCHDYTISETKKKINFKVDQPNPAIPESHQNILEASKHCPIAVFCKNGQLGHSAIREPGGSLRHLLIGHPDDPAKPLGKIVRSKNVADNNTLGYSHRFNLPEEAHACLMHLLPRYEADGRKNIQDEEWTKTQLNLGARSDELAHMAHKERIERMDDKDYHYFLDKVKSKIHKDLTQVLETVTPTENHRETMRNLARMI